MNINKITRREFAHGSSLLAAGVVGGGMILSGCGISRGKSYVNASKLETYNVEQQGDEGARLHGLRFLERSRLSYNQTSQMKRLRKMKLLVTIETSANNQGRS